MRGLKYGDGVSSPDAPPKPAVGPGPAVPASVPAVVVLYVLPFVVLWWAGPLAWVGLLPGAVGLHWTTHPPHQRRLTLLFLVLALVSLATLLLGLSGTDTSDLR